MNLLTTFTRLASFALLQRAFFLGLGGMAVPVLLSAAYQGPVPAPTDAFGGPAPYSVVTETLPSPDWPGHVVTVYRPSGVTGPRPTWFFAHGFGGISPTFYAELLTHLASHGSVAVFSPYPITSGGRPDDAYATLFDGFVAAANRFPDLIDTTRVGFGGHCYGGGAVPALALRGLREKGWGRNGLALLMLAPWYSFFVSDADLSSFPAQTQAIVQVYEADTVNDHRMAIDVFNHLNLPASEKDFLVVRTDRIDGYNYNADHLVPTGVGTPRPGASFDALDVWGVLRMAQALTASALERDPAARAVALGNGSAAQTQMGVAPSGRVLRPMFETDAPIPVYPEDRYNFAFHNSANPRGNEALPIPSLPPRLTNVSARAKSAPGEDSLIVGAIIAGDRPKNLLIRGVGPGLQSFGVAGAMRDPQLQTYDGPKPDVWVDDWEQAPGFEALQATTTHLGLFPLQTGSKDAALQASFSPGALTLHTSPVDNMAGVTLCELYDVEEDASTRLCNLSARAHVGAGEDLLIAGFITSGDGNLRILIRGVGPTLANYGLSNALSDAQLELFRGSEKIAANDNWSADPDRAAEIAAASAKVGAFPLPQGSADSAVLLELSAGLYTAQLRGPHGETGVGLIEIYVVP